MLRGLYLPFGFFKVLKANLKICFLKMIFFKNNTLYF